MFKPIKISEVLIKKVVSTIQADQILVLVFWMTTHYYTTYYDKQIKKRQLLKKRKQLSVYKVIP